MGILISLERERAVRELRETLGAVEASRIVADIRQVMELAEQDPELREALLSAVARDEHSHRYTRDGWP